MFDNTIFAQRLSSLRKAANLNQPQLAVIINVTKSTINKMESGNRAASIETICALADYFDVSLDFLVGRTDDPKRY